MSASDSPRRVAVTFVNHAGAVLVKVVPGERFKAAARLGVGFSPVSDAWRIDGLPDGDHPLAVPDRLVLAKLLIQRVTRRFGWRASFSPLPEAARVGNGGRPRCAGRPPSIPRS
jgi:hypothetical protein